MKTIFLLSVFSEFIYDSSGCLKLCCSFLLLTGFTDRCCVVVSIKTLIIILAHEFYWVWYHLWRRTSNTVVLSLNDHFTVSPSLGLLSRSTSLYLLSSSVLCSPPSSPLLPSLIGFRNDLEKCFILFHLSTHCPFLSPSHAFQSFPFLPLQPSKSVPSFHYIPFFPP